VEPINSTAAIYGNDPLYASIFQAIEDGANPIEAAKRARDQLGWKPTDQMNAAEEFNRDVVSIAQQYAKERVGAQQSRLDWQAKAQAADQGQNSALSTQSEYELMGAPSVDDLMSQYRTRMGQVGSAGVDTRNIPRQNPVSGGNKPVPNLPMTATPSQPWHGGAPGQFTSLRDQSDPLNSTSGTAGWNGQAPNLLDNITQAVQGTIASRTPGAGVAVGDWAQSVAPKPKVDPANQRFNEMIDKKARTSISNRVNKAKTTQVRSPENLRAMNTIMAMAAMMQGGFPE
jgi:hypothetical protein